MVVHLNSAQAAHQGAETVLVSSNTLDWTDLSIGAIKRLRRSPETGWAHNLLRGYPGQVNAPHTHEGPAMFYVLEGGFDFRGGSAVAGDWVWEPAGAVHEATSHSRDTVYYGVLFGTASMHDDRGRTAGYGDPIGAALVRTGDLPWLDDGHGGRIRVLRTSAETGWFHLMLKGQAGEVRAPHLRLGGCEMLVLEGEVAYGDNRLGPGDWTWEPAGVQAGEMRFNSDSLILVNCYGPALFGADDLMDWRSVRRLTEQA